MMPLALLVACLQAPPTMDADAGFQGSVFPDSWNRFSVLLTYEGAALDAELRITLRTYVCESMVFTRPVKLMRKARMRLGYDLFTVGDTYAADFELVAGDKVLQKAQVLLNQAYAPGVRLLAVGTVPDLVMEALGRKPPVAMVRLPADRLPASSLPLLSLHAVLLPEPVDLDPGQETALREWVEQGGKLIFGAGRSTRLRQNPFWRELCPLAAPEAASVPVRVNDVDLPMTVVRGKLLRGRAAFPVGGEPLVIRSRLGLGEVIFLPLVFDQDRLTRLVPSAPLLAEILNLPPPPKEDPVVPRRGFIPRPKEWLEGSTKPLQHEKTTDFLRQLLPAEFNLRFGPLAFGIFLLLLYVACLGPVEYLRLRRRGQLTRGWRSFGLLVLGFGFMMALWSVLFLPRAPRLAVLTLLDESRVQSFGALRPTRGGVFEVEAPGALTPLAPSRPFGAADGPDPITTSLPSSLRLAVPPSATRLLSAARSLEEGEGFLSAEWTTPERKALKVRNGASFSLAECWAVSKDEVWRLELIPAGATLTAELRNPYPFAKWASQQFKPMNHEPVWWIRESMWGKSEASRHGLILSFFGAIAPVWHGSAARHQLLQRGIDLSPALEAGETVLVGSFDRNVSRIRCSPDLPAETFGWARARVKEAGR